MGKLFKYLLSKEVYNERSAKSSIRKTNHRATGKATRCQTWTANDGQADAAVGKRIIIRLKEAVN